ncbi:phage tail assembly protein [Bradyrhizobium sp. BRP22]|uniref:phage tail assembly protein n=1 Tax=Bradyrhizobium sp. BRP22 TaxID=2793821 RepID=UPI001CD543DB|nr:phage tail assembly protein [Bradyrhizobium sp. BRP22]MCA1452835.1 phage tail assembly protein [Bradyrhizobium sp. BRP22]
MPEAALRAKEANGQAAEAAAAAAASAPAKAERVKEVVIDLTTAVMANGEMIKQLRFRRPTGGDIMSMGEGYPINIDWSTGQVRPNPAVMGMMMSTLAQVPPSTIKALDAEDWSTCAHALMGFFPPGAQAMQY